MKKKITNVLIIVLVSVFSLAIGATAATTIASTSVSYGDTTVKAALDELMTKASNIPDPVTCTPGHYCTTLTSCPSGALCSKVSIGDYVRMTPTITSYTIPAGATGYAWDQTIRPSELNLWRVIDIRDDGTIEMISEYVSSTNVSFNGQTGYFNLIGTLNLIAKQYENSAYTVGSRNIGYHGQTQVITDRSYVSYPAPWTTSTSDNSNETVGGGDLMYQYDTHSSTGIVKTALGTLVAKKVGTTTETTYWVSARSYRYTSSSYFYWQVAYVQTSGVLLANPIIANSGGSLKGTTISSAIRPIVTLRADITSYTGSGTSASPWVLS